MKILKFFLFLFWTLGLGELLSTTPPANTKKMDYKTCATSQCHSEIYNIQYPHSPIKAGGCNLCHEPILKTHTFKLFSNSRKMCTDCHDDFVKENFGKKDNKYTLKTDTELFSAHAIDDLLKDKKFLSTDLTLYNGTFECLTCHDPHGTNQVRLLRPIKNKGQEPALCYTCHENKFTPNLHTMGKDQCFECHGFHRNKLQTPLIKFEKEGADIVCMECHKEKKALLKAKHDSSTWSEEVKKHAQKFFKQPEKIFTPCQSCHSVHDSAHKGSLLVSKKSSEKLYRIDTFCLECHKNSEAKNITQIPHYFQHRSILISSIKDPSSDKEITPRFYSHLGERVKDPLEPMHLSCATCHNPHEKSQKYLTSSEKTLKFCATCHGQEAYRLYTKFHTFKKREKNGKK
ncbi:MAG: hypothetical protein HYW47_06675 [Deltaproteobacteria bacterium]|nr:hypothetical protein [Deltaproteobacteria bacterium]